MTFLHDPLTDPLNDWLDARATGKVPPATPDSDADLTDLLATARQLDHLARKNEQVVRTTRRHRTSWEDTMQPSNVTAQAPRSTHTTASATNAAPWTLPARRRRWWAGAFSITAVFAIMLGGWYSGFITGSLPGRGPEEPIRLSYMSFAAQGEEQLFEIADIPEASECTVEPMTVDEVMAALQGYTRQASILGTPTASPTPQAVKWTGPEGGAIEAAPSVLIAQADDVFREWVACHRTGDLFRAWTLESDQYLNQTILRMYGPLVSLETIRADLELMAADTNAETPLTNLQLADDTLIPMLVTSGWDSLVVNAPYGPLRIPVYWQSLDGAIAGVPGYLTQEQWEDPIYHPLRSKFLYNNAEFVLDADTGQLVIHDINANSAG